MSMSATKGVPVRGSTSATFSGSRRSNAAAKMTRVELRNTVPDQPNHHALMARTTINCTRRLETRKDARSAG